MYRKLADTIILDFTVHLPTTGAVSDADALPTVEIWEDETDTTLDGGTVTKRVNKTGNYRVAVVATTANGFEVGKSYNVVVTVIAGGVTAKAVIGSFAIDGKRLSDLNDIAAPDLSNLDVAVSTRAPEAAGNVAAIKSKTDNLPASPAAVGSVMGKSPATLAAADVSGNLPALVKAQDNIDFGALQKTSLNAATPASVQNIVAQTADAATRMATFSYTAPDNTSIGTILTMLQSVTYGLNALLTSIGTRMATFAYTAPDSAATIAAAVWNYLTASMTTVNSIGKKLADWVVGTIDTYTGNTKQTGDAFALLGTVRGTDNDTLKTLSDQLDTAQADLDNPSQYKATGFATPTNVSDAQAAIETAIDGIVVPPPEGVALEINVQGHVAAALTAYDPPTRTEATSDKAEIEALIAKVRGVLSNRLVVDSTTGAFTIYEDDGVTIMVTGTISETGRGVPTWG